MMTREEYLARSHWWRDKGIFFEQDEIKYWKIISEDDGMGNWEHTLRIVHGTLDKAIDFAVALGDSFYGWGHQGRIEPTYIEELT